MIVVKTRDVLGWENRVARGSKAGGLGRVELPDTTLVKTMYCTQLKVLNRNESFSMY